MFYPKLNSKKYPDFIRDNILVKNPDKVFPRIGLKNNRVDVKSLSAICVHIDTDRDVNKVLAHPANKIKVSTILPKTLANTKIVFSSRPWDIATMSMRGTISCMRWGKPSTASCLVGSISDPYTGIIYLTNGKNHIDGFGEEMIARSVVKVFLYKNKLAVYKEFPYFNRRFVHSDMDTENAISDIFDIYLINKSKIEVVPLSLIGKKCKLIMSKELNSLQKAEERDGAAGDYLPYVDSDIDYISSKKYFNSRNVRA